MTIILGGTIGGDSSFIRCDVPQNAFNASGNVIRATLACSFGADLKWHLERQVLDGLHRIHNNASTASCGYSNI